MQAALRVRYPLSLLSLNQLLSAYFVRFDQLASGVDLDYLRRFIIEQLARRNAGSLSSLAAIHKASELLFAVNGPKRVADVAVQEGRDLDEIVGALGLRQYSSGGRYVFLVRNCYYVQLLESIEVGSPHPVLAELSKQSVYESRFDDNRLIGHLAIEVLIDRSRGSVLSDAWRTVILNIAGDPRAPSTSPKFQRWWSLLGEARISLMRGWLSRFDLSLFLQVLEQSARDGNAEDIERMFPPRKNFLEGLLKEGLITNSRLFLSSYAENYLRRRYKASDLPDYARVTSSQTSMIYVTIADRIHLLEGSHSFPVKLFDRLPSDSVLKNPAVRVVSDENLRTGELGKYIRSFGGSQFLSQNHYPLLWQHEVLRYLLRQGIQIDPAKVLSPADYRQYKYRFGL